jgi:hypothetical protein
MTLSGAIKAYWFTAALGFALAVLVYQNVTLGTINSALRARVIETLVQPVTVGSRVGELRGVRLDGTYDEVDPKKANLLVFTISPFCGVCQKNLPQAVALADLARDRGLRVVWVSRDNPSDTVGYFSTASVIARTSDTILTEPPHATYQALRMSFVPQVLVVDRAGVVQHVVAGALDPARQIELQHAIVGQRVPKDPVADRQDNR